VVEETVYCTDLTDRDAVRQACADAEVVVHLAARAHSLGRVDSHLYDEIQHTNVEGTRIVAEEALAAGVKQFVFMSSIGAICQASHQPVTEATIARPTSLYGISKLRAESLVSKACSDAGVDAAIVRPPIVYGPGMKGNPLRLFEWIGRGVPLPLMTMRNRRSAIFVGNLVAAIERLIERRVSGVRTYCVADEEAPAVRDFVRMAADAMGRRVHTFPVPRQCVMAAAAIGNILPKGIPWPISKATASSLIEPLVIDASEIQRSIGFSPPYTMAEGLATTASWFRTQLTRC